MIKGTRKKIIILFVLLCICTGCGAQDEEDAKRAVNMDSVQEGMAEGAYDSTDAGQETESGVGLEQTDPKDAKLLCLMYADMEPLFGLSFGDRIDYTRFEMCGGWGYEPVYREIAREECYIIFHFQGEGHCFSGFESKDLEFLGIGEEDRVERLIYLYGEPDTLQEKNEKETVQWNFEKASLEVTVKNGFISYVNYTAAEGVADGEKIPYEQTDFAQDSKRGYDYMETIYLWEPENNGRKEESAEGVAETDAFYHPYDEGYDADYTDTFVKEYLKKQGIEKKEPDGTLYNRKGEIFVEYYIEEAEKKYCFIVHMWGNYWMDYEAGVSAYQDAIFCTTHRLEEADWAGTFLYNVDKENEIMRERLYDTEGMNKADISYKNWANAPIALITDYWYIESGYDAGRGVLCRGQKFWFSEAQIEAGTGLDDAGAAGVLADDAFFSEPCTFSYDEEGRLKLIEEDLIDGEEEGRENSGQVEFQYDESGILKKADYQHSPWTHATTDCSGTIAYDEKGRMIYNDYYITHGGHTDIFLYKENSNLPWACLNWCSFGPGLTGITLFKEGGNAY